jgi:microcystin degradation protein MlrC
MAHETNTFASQPTDLATWERAGIRHGAEIERIWGNSHATMAGFLDIRERMGVDVEPLLFTFATPAGTITAEAYDRITGEMLDLLRDRGPWDGILLAQHGAAVAENAPDMDGEVAARVREQVGPNVPIGMALDLHANVSQQMIDNSTVTTVYRTNPHLDPRPRALECAELIVRAARGEIRPVQALEMPPLVVDILRQYTGEQPMQGLMEDLASVLARPGILSGSVVEGYPYADVAEMGMSFLVVSDGDPNAARDGARWLAERAWSRRAELVGSAPSPEQALRAAQAAERGPIVLMDVGDNVGGGSPGDSTILLAEAQRLGVRSFLVTLYDPESVAQCVAAGADGRVDLQVGGKTDQLHGAPVPVTGTVLRLADGHFEEPNPIHGGHRFFDQGQTAVVETDDGHTLILTSKLILPLSIQQVRSVGVRPEDFKVIVAKGVVSPRPAYQPIAAQIVLVDTPGVTRASLDGFLYHRRRRPLFPFERDTAY